MCEELWPSVEVHKQPFVFQAVDARVRTLSSSEKREKSDGVMMNGWWRRGLLLLHDL